MTTFFGELIAPYPLFVSLPIDPQLARARMTTTLVQISYLCVHEYRGQVFYELCKSFLVLDLPAPLGRRFCISGAWMIFPFAKDLINSTGAS